MHEGLLEFKTHFIVGGAGFIGSSLARYIMALSEMRRVNSKIIIYDNFSSGKLSNVIDLAKHENVEIYDADVIDFIHLMYRMASSDIVYHFASNADISKAVNDPTIDFKNGTVLTQNVLEAVRKNGISNFFYASGSGVYGNHGMEIMTETCSPMYPTSPYGASKLAGEALTSAYSHMYDIKSTVCRFANVVGERQTHGVIMDFITKLHRNPSRLDILGNGKQLKSYIHISDVLAAINRGISVTTDNDTEVFNVFNVSNHSLLTVTDIAEIVITAMGIKEHVELVYSSDEPKGWEGDIGMCRMDSNKLTYYGWNPIYSSRSAVQDAAFSLFERYTSNGYSWE